MNEHTLSEQTMGMSATGVSDERHWMRWATKGTSPTAPAVIVGRTELEAPAVEGPVNQAWAATVERSVGAVGLAAIGLIHLLDAPGKYSETPYMFWMYLALIAGCLCAAALLLRAPSRAGWAMAATLSALPFIGYVFSRTTGLPGAMGDIGNWTEPLGLASLFVEACVFAVGLYGLTLARKAQFRVHWSEERQP